MSDDKKSAPSNNEKELNDLLDNALKDFDSTSNTMSSANVPAESIGENGEVWNEDFFAEQAKLLGERVNALFGEGTEAPTQEQINVGFQRMAEAAARALQGEGVENDAGKKYADSITEALKGLKEGVDNLQAPVSETDVVNMFSSLNLSESEESESNPFLPFMQGMMQSLLSAEILLPSMKELLEKYPKYLEENGDKIEAADKERYIKQQELFAVICTDLEAEKPDDTSDIKQERFKRVLDNMQKLHEYGQPPVDLLIDVESGLGNTDIAAGAGQCPLM